MKRGDVNLEMTRQAVVVAVDGSAASTAAVAWAAADAALRHLPVTLVHVASRWRGGGHEAQAILIAAATAARSVVGFGEFDVETRCLRGRPVEVLAKLTRQADRMVMGFRGSGVLGAGLLGPLTEGVLHQARCPVAVVHAGGRGNPHAARGPILVGVDDSASSVQAVALAFEAARLRATPLVAVHVVDDDAALRSAGWADTLEAALEPCRRDYPNVEVSSSVVIGDPSAELISRAGSAQLVVVGNRGRGGVARTLLGSVSSAVLGSVDVPVLVAREVVPSPKRWSTTSRSAS